MKQKKKNPEEVSLTTEEIKATEKKDDKKKRKMSFQKACILYSVFAFLLMASAITGGAYFVQMDKYYYVRTMIFGLAFCIMTIFGVTLNLIIKR